MLINVCFIMFDYLKGLQWLVSLLVSAITNYLLQYCQLISAREKINRSNVTLKFWYNSEFPSSFKRCFL